MAKFRIKYTSLKMVDDISLQPKQETQDFFDKVISEFRKNDASDNAGKIIQINEKTQHSIKQNKLTGKYKMI